MDPEVFIVILQLDYTVDYSHQFNSSFPRISYTCDMSGQMGREFCWRKCNCCCFLELCFCKSMSLCLVVLYSLIFAVCKISLHLILFLLNLALNLVCMPTQKCFRYLFIFAGSLNISMLILSFFGSFMRIYYFLPIVVD